MKLTKHFSLEEFTNTSHKDLIEENKNESLSHIPILLRTAKMLEEVRELLKVPLHISSGFRYTKLNKRVGGKYNSRHQAGLAADIIPAGLNLDEAFNKILNSNIKSIRKCIIEGINGKFWIHITVKLNEEEKTQFFKTKDGVHYEEVFGINNRR